MGLISRVSSRTYRNYNMSNNPPYLGCTLSVISKAQIRYKGILTAINQEGCTLTLTNVKSYGSEDRLKPQVIPETAGIYETIVFNGHDIHEVKVTSSVDEVQDPAIIQAKKTNDEKKHLAPGSGKPKQQQQQQQHPPRDNRNNRRPEKQQAQPPADSSWKNNKSMAENMRKPVENDRRENNDEYRQNAKKEREERERREKEKMAEKYKDEFDFSSMNKKFDKEKIAKDLEKMTVGERKRTKESDDEDSDAEEEKEQTVYYEPKKSFFDNISCEANETREERGRINRHEERKLNSQTFGIPAYGRGRGRGCYQGGFNNRGGYNNGYQNRGYSNRGGYNNSRGGYHNRRYNNEHNSYDNRRRQDE